MLLVIQFLVGKRSVLLVLLMIIQLKFASEFFLTRIAWKLFCVRLWMPTQQISWFSNVVALTAFETFWVLDFQMLTPKDSTFETISAWKAIKRLRVDVLVETSFVQVTRSAMLASHRLLSFNVFLVDMFWHSTLDDHLTAEFAFSFGVTFEMPDQIWFAEHFAAKVAFQSFGLMRVTFVLS